MSSLATVKTIAMETSKDRSHDVSTYLGTDLSQYKQPFTILYSQRSSLTWNMEAGGQGMKNQTETNNTFFRKKQ